VKSLTRKALKNKEIEIAKDVKNNPKKFWQYTKSKTKTRIGISDLIMNNENGVETLTNSDKDKANTLSDFSSIVFTTETTDNYPSLEGINISYNMGTLVIDEEKLKKRLHELNISKSPGPDGLHPEFYTICMRSSENQ
jgi:phosphoenolpyruvate synthase/pyruvate phosphate dikinase